MFCKFYNWFRNSLAVSLFCNTNFNNILSAFKNRVVIPSRSDLIPNSTAFESGKTELLVEVNFVNFFLRNPHG